MGYCMPPRNQPRWECLHHGNWQMIQIRAMFYSCSLVVCLEKGNSEVANVRIVKWNPFLLTPSMLLNNVLKSCLLSPYLLGLL